MRHTHTHRIGRQTVGVILSIGSTGFYSAAIILSKVMSQQILYQSLYERLEAQLN